MTWASSLTLSAALFHCSAGHMSMQFPSPRDTINGASYAVWQQNEPMWSVHPDVCHGLDEDATVRDGNTFAAGNYVEIDIYGSAPHDGGHCAFWWTTDESSDWYKIIDITDCTLADTFYVLMPYTMSTDCATKCTFAFSWVPVSSGACEVYMNCAEISVSGTTGVETSEAITINFQTDIIDASNCVRVDDTTHYTTIFGEIKDSYTSSDTDGGATTVGNADDDEVITVNDDEIDDEIEEESTLCANENARDIEGEIRNNGNCTCTNCRCDDGQCCSQFGFCGPELDGYDSNGNPQYIDYDSSNQYYSSQDDAFDAYCTNHQGDWRLIDCEDDGNGESDDDSSVEKIGNNIFSIVVGMAGMIIVFAGGYLG